MEASRPCIKDEVCEDKIREAISLIGIVDRDVGKMVERRLKHVVVLGGRYFSGSLIIHNSRGESVFGEYHIHANGVKMMSVEALAKRLVAAAWLIELEEDSRQYESWSLSGDEVESIFTKDIFRLAKDTIEIAR